MDGMDHVNKSHTPGLRSSVLCTCMRRFYPRNSPKRRPICRLNPPCSPDFFAAMEPIPTDQRIDTALQKLNGNSSIVLFRPLPRRVLCPPKMRASRSHTRPVMEAGVLADGQAWAHSGSTSNMGRKPVGSQAKCIEWIARSIRSLRGWVENDADPIGSVPNSIEFDAVSTGFGTKPVETIAFLISIASISIGSILDRIQFILMFMHSDADRIHSTSVPVGSAAIPRLRQAIIWTWGRASALSRREYSEMCVNLH